MKEEDGLAASRRERRAAPLLFRLTLFSPLSPPPPLTLLPPPQLLSNIFGERIEGCLADPNNSLYPSCYNTSYTLPESEGGWLIGPASDPGSVRLHKATDWLPRFLHYIQDTWNPVNGIAIAEFGFSEPFEAYKALREDILTDPLRTLYYDDYVQAMLMAVLEGVKLVGCSAWSMAG